LKAFVLSLSPLQVGVQTADANNEYTSYGATGAASTTKAINIQPNPNFFNDIFNVSTFFPLFAPVRGGGAS
jgi:hypothetical protein